MAVGVPYERDSVGLLPALKMKEVLEALGPDGSRVTSEQLTPQLGDGLSGITFDSPAPRMESTIPTTGHGGASSISTSSSSAPVSPLSTPGYSAEATAIIPHPSANKQIEASPTQDGHSSFVPNDQDIHSRLPALAEGLTQLCLAEGARIQSPQPLTSTPAPDLSAHTEIAKTSPDPITKNTSPVVSASDKISAWLLEGKLSLTEARGMAQRYQCWDLLKVLGATSTFKKQTVAAVDINQPQQCDTSKLNIEPNEDPAMYTPNPQCFSAHSRSPSPIEQIIDRFYLKLTAYVNLDRVISPNVETNLHVFVDMSNIFIGFCDTYKAARRIPRNRRISAPTFSFKALSLVLERGRGIQKRVLAGSISNCSANDHRAHWPEYFLDAEALGYTMNIFSRVQTRKLKRRGRTPPDGGYLSAEDSVGDDGAVKYEVRNAEQGVDENLHLNMMNSMLDNLSRPGTMVLATGDAAEAEFSGGFLQYATRALNNGWKLELVAWKSALSSAWTNPGFVERYAHQFRIIFLDDFFEELQAEYVFS
ncbi:hypothetical protein F5Y13DRAFT_199543 [Hypoxylon sp. FL1857]|nr:hypothetical protein F5Y13DRAFT_199543 [Hypoxylon sp. FL1857]